MSRTRPTLLLSGFMGTGKSTVGRLVAARAGIPFVDLDERVEQASGQSVGEIFATGGEAAFRALELQALSEVLDAAEPRVVALGGGTLLDRATRLRALGRARVVTLTARPDTLLARTASGGRPLLNAHADRRARITELLELRASAYAETHASVPTDDREPAEVAAAATTAWATPTIAVPLGLRSYAVRVVDDAAVEAAHELRRLAPSRVFVVTDANVLPLWGARLLATIESSGLPVAPPVVLDPGEPHKQLAGVERALRSMVEAGADRDAVVVAIGGGVVSDMAGFAAATLLRGVRWVAVPTTLLAMVDASVGGKTGVDLGPAKNAIGAFHQPSAVVTSPAFVSTQLRRDFVGGLAEVVKSAVLGDRGLFDLLETETAAIARQDPDVVLRLVVGSVAVKAGIVGRDERESGERLLLNFGHTVGHALEAEGGFERLTHGEAVSLGIVAALCVGVRLGVTPAALADRVTAALARLSLPTELRDQPVAEALRWVDLDKKRRGGALRFVLLRAIGDAVVRRLTREELGDVLGAR